MAIEPKRGCGYRKVHGLYLVGGGIGIPCDRLPFELTVCACCGQGIKQARGWTWIDVAKFFNGPHVTDSHVLAPEYRPVCKCMKGRCPLCSAPETLGRAGLVWVGEKFYKTPDQFLKEGVALGFSRRIKAIPQGFKVGETYVMLAHSKAVSHMRAFELESGKELSTDPAVLVNTIATIGPAAIKRVEKPGIFYAWLPQRLELIMKESQRNSDESKAAEKRGITPIYVPDNDKDHQGNVHDDLENEKKEAE